jgi:hypothetical protein
MKKLTTILLGATLACGSATLALGDDKYKEKTKVDEPGYKEETKIKDKHGKYKEETTVKEPGYTEKTKVKSKNGKTKVETKEKGTPPE